MIQGTRRSILMGSALALGAPTTALSEVSAPLGGFVCAPCGCALDGRLFSAPGLCPACGMERIPATAVSSELVVDFPSVQLEMRVPFPPTAVPSNGREHLIYELHLRNFGNRPLPLGGLEILDPTTNRTVADFEGASLEALISPIGPGALTVSDRLMLGSGRSCVVYLRLISVNAAPSRLQHRIRAGEERTTGPVIDVASSQTLRRLGSPLKGSDWVPANNAGADDHHRVGLLAVDGVARVARRYAIDWKRQRGGAWFDGDEADVRSYHAYGQTVLAVADATVVVATDGFPDNRPRTHEGFEPAQEVTMHSVGGNVVTLDLGDGLFASYAHLQPGSVKVRAGDRVSRGQALGAIGNSGDSRWPHLHFQVTDGPSLLGSEGVPYVIDAYSEVISDRRERRRGEMPMSQVRIDFA